MLSQRGRPSGAFTRPPVEPGGAGGQRVGAKDQPSGEPSPTSCRQGLGAGGTTQDEGLLLGGGGLEGGLGADAAPPGVPHSMSIRTCSIFIMGTNLTNGEFRLITFRPEK